MREIKFRAWDKNKKVMVYDGDTKWGGTLTYPVTVINKGIIFCTKGKWGRENEVRDSEGNVGYKDWEKDAWYQEVEIMQFTGLKDRNGQDIYEGDILIDDDTDEVDYAKVEWFEGGWSAHPWFGAQEFFNEAEGYEVVGNIYENPELLK